MVTVFDDRVTDKVTDNLSDNQERIVSLMLSDRYISTNKLAEQLKISQRKIKENIAKLKEIGLIKRIGKAKGGHWEIVES